MFNEVPIFLFFFIKGEEDEGDSVTKVRMIKKPSHWLGFPPKLSLKHKLIVCT
jgi:hypothetical protein